MINNLKHLTLAGFVLVAGLTLSNCKDDAETPAPAQPAPTPTPTVENTLTYDNLTIDSMSGACEFGTELNVIATGIHDNRTYTLYAIFPGTQVAAGTYTTILPGETVTDGKCSVYVLRQFSGTTQSIYAPANLAVTLTIENGNYRVTFPKTKFVAIGSSSFFANISASKVGCR